MSVFKPIAKIMPRVDFVVRLVKNPFKCLLMGFLDFFVASMNIAKKQALKDSVVRVLRGNDFAVLEDTSESDLIM